MVTVSLSLLAQAATAFHVPYNVKSVLTALSESKMNDIYRKGGNAGYTEPSVQPSRLDSVTDCEDAFIDLATGDELCWNEQPQHARNVAPIPNMSHVKLSFQHLMDSFVDNLHYKGGNAAFRAVLDPRKLKEDCDEQFFDFATGDELCWV